MSHDAHRVAGEPRTPNRLAGETSPYLLQHQYNPVDWYPWGPEALARARREDKPLLLSVGYSACHWCHVMERESFEDPDIARLMNERFVNVKVDREERPDIDSIYMQAVQAMTGHGGWPMTVFLTPDGVPFYGGTYFPPADRHGMPGFPRVLEAVAEFYRDKRGEATQVGRELLERLRQGERVRAGTELLTPSLLDAAYQGLRAEFDSRHGGLGRAPKFPQPMAFDFLLRYWRRRDAPEALQMVRQTLTQMARGGIYDQLGGGFHRYSVDQVWLVPHFEKMLYDQAQLALLYLQAWQATGDPEYRRVTEETLDYVVREMTHPDGRLLLDPGRGLGRGGRASSSCGTGRRSRPSSIPRRPAPPSATGAWPTGRTSRAGASCTCRGSRARWRRRSGSREDRLRELLGRARAALFAHREGRIKPGRDEKVLAGWNGMMLRAFAEASRALDRPDYLRVAERNAGFLLSALVRDGRLLRTWKDGRAKLLGYLEDHAMVVDGLLALHEATLDRRWLDAARRLAAAMVDLFWDPQAEGFFDTGRDHETLVVRPRSLFDSAVPCGSSVAADVLLRLAVLTGSSDLERRAVETIRSVAPLMSRYPSGFGRFLAALDFHLGPAGRGGRRLARGGPSGRPGAARGPLLGEVFRRYLPNRVVVGGAEGTGADLALLAGKRARGRPTAYVCERYACQAPTTEPGRAGKPARPAGGRAAPAAGR